MAVQKKREPPTIRVTRRTYEALRRRAARTGADLEKMADTLLRQALAERADARPSESERDQIRRILRQEGLIVEDLDEYKKLIEPGLDYEAIRAELAALRLDPPLSETIISERHEE